MKRKNSWISVVMPYFKKYKWYMIFDLFCAAMTTISELILPLLVRYLAKVAQANPDDLTLNLIVRISLIFLVVKLIEIVSGYFMTRMGHIVGAYIETDMRSDVYDHLQTLPDSYYNETKVGQIMSRITNDLFDITEFAHHCPEEYTIGAIKLIVTFAILFNIQPDLTIALYILIPIMFYFSDNSKHKMSRAQMDQREHIGQLNSSIEDSLLGIRVVKSFANEDIEKEKFERDNSKFLDIKKGYYTSMASFMTVTRIFDGLMYLVVIAVGGFLMYRKKMTGSDMLAFTMYVTTLLATVKRIVEFTEQFQKGQTGVARFKDIMDTESDLIDSEDAKELKDVIGKIEFSHVYFKYEEYQEDYVLRDFSLRVEPGQKVAIVGPSGSGKTTITNLIPRFYDVNGGAVLVDDKDVRDLTMKSLRDHIGIVQQDVYLFSGTVAENIRYGKPGASDEEVVEAAKLASAYDFIMELEDGFDTYIGERGIKLSGGQKQRLSIARVFLKNPPILILDEATSALDNQSELLIQESLDELAKGRTTVTIAHRLTTVQDSDIIYVMTADGIIEEGNHEELMEKKGYYYKLYNRDLIED